MLPRPQLLLIGAALAIVTAAPPARAQSYAPPPGSTPGGTTRPVDGYAPREAPWDTTDARPDEGRSVDPLIPTGITTTAVGSIVLLAGASQLQDQGGGDQACGLSGCVDVEYPGSQSPEASMYLAGGGVIAAGGTAMLLYGLAEPQPRATAGRARIAAGAMGLSMGAGSVVMGAIEASSDHASGAGTGLLVAGVITSTISGPILLWGASTADEGEKDDEYASDGRIIGGSILTGTGIALGTAGAAIVGASSDCSGGLCGFGFLFAVPPIAASAACLGVGIPLFAGGAAIEPASATPEVAVGAGDVQLSWRFQ
jgi:hypothetical protein